MTEEQQAEPVRHVRIVYCGGCNPHIERTAVAAEVPTDDPEEGVITGPTRDTKMRYPRDSGFSWKRSVTWVSSRQSSSLQVDMFRAVVQSTK